TTSPASPYERTPAPHCAHLSTPAAHRHPPSSPTRRSSDLSKGASLDPLHHEQVVPAEAPVHPGRGDAALRRIVCAELLDVECLRSEEHTSELQSRENLVCRLLLEKKKAGESRQHGPRPARA